jgi:putative ABC transport system permease protein
MIKNYFLIAWRNLRAGKAYTAINIVGLAIGLAVCLIILLYIFEETAYDRQHAGADRLYRINTSFKSKTDQSKIHYQRFRWVARLELFPVLFK